MYLGGVEGTVFVTMKAHVPTRVQHAVHHGRRHHSTQQQVKPGEPCTLVRATCGKKKISTLVRVCEWSVRGAPRAVARLFSACDGCWSCGVARGDSTAFVPPGACEGAREVPVGVRKCPSHVLQWCAGEEHAEEEEGTGTLAVSEAKERRERRVVLFCFCFCSSIEDRGSKMGVKARA